MNNIQRIQFKHAVQGIAPNAPEHVILAIIDRETRRPQFAALDTNSYALVAFVALGGYIRHNMTDYDYLLAEKHLMRFQAQLRVHAKVTAIMGGWQ